MTEHPWKLSLIIGSFLLLILWTILVYGIIYYINFGITELKRNILDYIALNLFMFSLGTMTGKNEPFKNLDHIFL